MINSDSNILKATLSSDWTGALGRHANPAQLVPPIFGLYKRHAPFWAHFSKSLGRHLRVISADPLQPARHFHRRDVISHPHLRQRSPHLQPASITCRIPLDISEYFTDSASCITLRLPFFTCEKTPTDDFDLLGGSCIYLPASHTSSSSFGQQLLLIAFPENYGGLLRLGDTCNLPASNPPYLSFRQACTLSASHQITSHQAPAFWPVLLLVPNAPITHSPLHNTCVSPTNRESV